MTRSLRSLSQLLYQGMIRRDESIVEPHGLELDRGLTFDDQSFTINTIRGDSESVVEIQPHLNAGLWPVYLEQCDMQYRPPPSDGTQEAPGAHPQNPPVPT